MRLLWLEFITRDLIYTVLRKTAFLRPLLVQEFTFLLAYGRHPEALLVHTRCGSSGIKDLK